MDGETLVGELLFGLIMKKSTIDTCATETHLRENLTNLETYVFTINSNIDQFNQYVNVNVDRLKARVECTDYLIANFFKS